MNVSLQICVDPTLHSFVTDEMRFFDLIRGAFKAAPTREEPVKRIPLEKEHQRIHNIAIESANERANAYDIEAIVYKKGFESLDRDVESIRFILIETDRPSPRLCLISLLSPLLPFLSLHCEGFSHQAAPTTDKPIARPMPIAPYEYGLIPVNGEDEVNTKTRRNEARLH